MSGDQGPAAAPVKGMPMLTFAEEVLLLSHDETEGVFLTVPDLTLNIALAGSVLMDLALADRIDTDLSMVTVLDDTPTGEPVLDEALAAIVAEKPLETCEWLDRLRHHGSRLFMAALDRLIERGILRRQDTRVLWVFERRRYPLLDSHQQRDVKLRIASLLLSEELPDPRDVMIIALCDSCDLLRRVFAEEELRSSSARLEQIVQLDLIGRSVRAVIWDMQSAVMGVAGYVAAV